MGVFDSGYGGLTILRELQSKIKGVDFIYFSDNKRAPYGNRPINEIVVFTIQCVDFLIKCGCSVIIIACNTATAHTIDILKSRYQPDIVNIIGVINPTVSTTISVTKNKKVGILATKSTIESNKYLEQLSQFGIQVTQHACPEWVDIIENMSWTLPENLSLIKRDLDALLSKNPEIDTLILGCTHFGIIENIIRQFLPDNIQIVNQSKIIWRCLTNLNSLKVTNTGSTHYYTTEDNLEFDEEFAILFGEDIQSTKVRL